MLKAAREAKQRTSWTQQNAEFEEALAKFCGGGAGRRRICKPIWSVFVEGVKEAGRAKLAGADADEVHGAGRAGPVPGRGAMGPEAWWTLTTAGRWTTRLRARLLREVNGGGRQQRL